MKKVVDLMAYKIEKALIESGFEVKMDDIILFQKLTQQEKVLLAALSYISSNAKWSAFYYLDLLVWLVFFLDFLFKVTFLLGDLHENEPRVISLLLTIVLVHIPMAFCSLILALFGSFPFLATCFMHPHNLSVITFSAWRFISFLLLGIGIL